MKAEDNKFHDFLRIKTCGGDCEIKVLVESNMQEGIDYWRKNLEQYFTDNKANWAEAKETKINE